MKKSNKVLHIAQLKTVSKSVPLRHVHLWVLCNLCQFMWSRLANF